MPPLPQICKKLYDTGKPKDLRDRTILLCAWFGAFRRAELAAMTWWASGAETLVKAQQGHTYLLKHSKTDQSGEGKIKILPYQSQVEICPVRALDALKEISEGDIVFMGMSKSGKILHNSMSDKAVDRVVKKYFGPKAKAHGLRARFITEAAVKGNSLHSIANQTGHKNLSTLRGYMREVDAW
ncbi:MAG: tyrosine-type recombinase/integrase, partial [Bacteroidota bacterium]